MGKKFQSEQAVNVFKRINTVLRAKILYNINSSFVSSTYTFSMAGSIIVQTPIRGTTNEKYFNHNIYTGQMPTLEGNEHLSVYFS